MSSSLEVKEFSLAEEYKKPNCITSDDVMCLRQWLKTQPHLPEQYITDLDLILTYHCCENSFEVAKQVLDLNYTLKTLFNDFFKDRQVDDKIEKVLNTALLCPLPERTREGYKVFYSKLIDYDPKNFNFSNVMRTVLMVLDLWQYEEGTWPGFVIVMDLEGMVLGHVAKLDLQTIKHYLYFLQEAALVKLKSIHYTNAPSFMDKIMTLTKPFMKKALIDMRYVHLAGSKTLDAHVPMNILPREAGGSYKTFVECKSEIFNKMQANKDFFIMENRKRVTESKRPGRAKTISDIFHGVEGTFKKLNID